MASLGLLSINRLIASCAPCTSGREPFFGNLRAVDVTYAVVEQYKSKRKEAGVSPSTINRELALVKRCFRLGHKAGMVRYVPPIDMLKESAPRTGFLETEQVQKLAVECSKIDLWLRAMFEVGANFGWRISELLNLRVRQVDLNARTLRLEVGSTKNGDARTAVMPSLLYSLISQCVAGKSADQFVFSQKGGKRIGDPRVSWYKACCAAGVGRMICRTCNKTVVSSGSKWQGCSNCKTGTGGLKFAGTIFHDLRRTAVRNMVRAGISELSPCRFRGIAREVFLIATTSPARGTWLKQQCGWRCHCPSLTMIRA